MNEAQRTVWQVNPFGDELMVHWRPDGVVELHGRQQGQMPTWVGALLPGRAREIGRTLMSPPTVDPFPVAYIVFRPAPDFPHTAHPWGGHWYERELVTDVVDHYPLSLQPPWIARGAPTDRYEAREDGAIAQVWEVRPHTVRHVPEHEGHVHIDARRPYQLRPYEGVEGHHG